MRVLKDKLWLSLIGVIAIFAVAVAYLLSQVLDIPLVPGKSRSVNIELTSTGGLFEGSAVTYRGIKVGKVTQIRLTDAGATAKVRLTKGGDKIPANTRAAVRSLSPVGEQYLDFQPKSQNGPYLQNGSTIKATFTDLPRTLGSTVIAISKVLDQIDSDKLQVLLTELSTALAGTGQDIGRMIDQGEILVNDLDRLWPETSRLLTNGGTVLDITTDKAGQLTQLAHDARVFAKFLRTYDPELRRNLKTLPRDFRTLKAVVNEIARSVPGFLKASVGFTNFLHPYRYHIREVLQKYAPGIGALARAISGGVLHISLINENAPQCDYGTPERSARETTRRPMEKDRHCTQNIVIPRGEKHAPGPVR
jgi:virulence factor Mce-like protein